MVVRWKQLNIGLRIAVLSIFFTAWFSTAVYTACSIPVFPKLIWAEYDWDYRRKATGVDGAHKRAVLDDVYQWPSVEEHLGLDDALLVNLETGAHRFHRSFWNGSIIPLFEACRDAANHESFSKIISDSGDAVVVTADPKTGAVKERNRFPSHYFYGVSDLADGRYHASYAFSDRQIGITDTAKSPLNPAVFETSIEPIEFHAFTSSPHFVTTTSATTMLARGNYTHWLWKITENGIGTPERKWQSNFDAHILDGQLVFLSADNTSLCFVSIPSCEVTDQIQLPAFATKLADSGQFVFHEGVAFFCGQTHKSAFDLRRKSWLRTPHGPTWSLARYDSETQRSIFLDPLNHSVHVFDRRGPAVSFPYRLTVNTTADFIDSHRFAIASPYSGFTVDIFRLSDGTRIQSWQPFAWVPWVVLLLLAVFVIWWIAFSSLVVELKGSWLFDVVMLIAPVLILCWIRLQIVDGIYIPEMTGVITSSLLVLFPVVMVIWAKCWKCRWTTQLIIGVIGAYMLTLGSRYLEDSVLELNLAHAPLIAILISVVLVLVVRLSMITSQPDAESSTTEPKRLIKRGRRWIQLSLYDLIVLTASIAGLVAALRETDSSSSIWEFLVPSIDLNTVGVVVGVAMAGAVCVTLSPNRFSFRCGMVLLVIVFLTQIARGFSDFFFIAWQFESLVAIQSFGTCFLFISLACIPLRRRGYRITPVWKSESAEIG